MRPVESGPDWRTRGELWIARAVKACSQRWPQALPPYELPAVRVLEAGTMPPAGQGIAGVGTSEHREIPRTLWAYWHTSALPPLVARCLQGWQRLHPDWRIELLDEHAARTHVRHWPEALERATVHQRADWLRLALLHEHGGIWLDVSTILTRPLDWVLREQVRSNSDFVGFYLQRFTSLPQFPVVENWFMAAPPHSRFIADLQDEFTTQVVQKSNRQYIRHLQDEGVYESVLQKIDGPHYLSQHLAIQRVLQRPTAGYRLSLWRAEDTAFLYHEQAGWDRARLKQRLFFMPANGAVAPLIKLRGPDRRKLDHYLAQRLYLDDSIAGRYLSGAGA